MQSPLIAITSMSRTDNPELPNIIGARISYLRCLQRCGATPLIVPLELPHHQIRRLLQLCSGLLLPGGEDVDPGRYNEAPHAKLGVIDQKRDELELSAIAIARELELPVLGICRGCQVLNVAYGGTLYQDIDSQRPQHDQHLQSRDEEVAHPMHIAANSKLSSILGPEDIDVNSFHHQAVKDLGANLMASGHSNDGLIEAIESVTEEFVLGVQCHPELMWHTDTSRWSQLFNAFVAKAKSAGR
jgi:putative glutamine amidotransferase